MKILLFHRARVGPLPSKQTRQRMQAGSYVKMMHPEAVGDWRPGSSDDDWSIVDEPEVQRNKVPGRKL